VNLIKEIEKTQEVNESIIDVPKFARNSTIPDDNIYKSNESYGFSDNENDNDNDNSNNINILKMGGKRDPSQSRKRRLAF
jgi:hypothetical protein